MDLLDQFKGCILGAAIGDALGMPVEGLTREEIKKIHGEIKDFLPSPYGDLKAGEWTDDTEQMIVLAESILETTYLNPENFAEKLKKWYIDSKNPRIGPTSSRALRNLINNIPWNKAGVYSDTCGAAMRVMPVGLVYHFSLNLVERYAVISASVTHKGTAAIGGAVAIATAISCVCLDFEKDELVNEVAKRVEKYDDLLAEKIEYSYQISDKDIDFAIEKLGNSISALDVVPMAFYCYFSSETFDDCVIKATNIGGDTDSIAAMAGGVKGCESVIPKKWFKKLKDYDYLTDLADRLYELHQRIVKLT
ncbi:ADP-ribosylglycohydrolase family protein [Archaeoglobales archaeon]|nr:MAG: ADP-ribosylglycohydrolase family protein [Archaeoglobales archaeon]